MPILPVLFTLAILAVLVWVAWRLIQDAPAFGVGTAKMLLTACLVEALLFFVAKAFNISILWGLSLT